MTFVNCDNLPVSMRCTGCNHDCIPFENRNLAARVVLSMKKVRQLQDQIIHTSKVFYTEPHITCTVL